MTHSEFTELAKDLFQEYLPKVNKTDRNSFIKALIAELEDNGVDLDSDFEEEDSDGVEELEF